MKFYKRYKPKIQHGEAQGEGEKCFSHFLLNCRLHRNFARGKTFLKLNFAYRYILSFAYFFLLNMGDSCGFLQFFSQILTIENLQDVIFTQSLVLCRNTFNFCFEYAMWGQSRFSAILPCKICKRHILLRIQFPIDIKDLVD